MNLENRNYELLGQDFLEELNSTVYHLRHKKTKAEVLYIENGDEIKTFGIGFRTPPVDSTGVAHIVEHCVLSGSRKYRTKEPFMDMVNSSMQTFLNAMTYPDKTIYPIATRNEKDFYNLMDVYLDAVFYPRIQDVKEIFEQEGWHLELENPDGELKYNGVVYNEMRGAYSDADGQVHELLAHHLHPNSTYDHDSGGDPHEIVRLSYEDFIGFHKRYYHPSNSYIFLNGKMDVEKVLEYINEEYLSDFEYQDPNSNIVINESFTSVKKLEDFYSVGKDDDIENKSYFAYGVDLGLSTNPDDNFMRAILTDILIDSDSSILSDTLLESKLGEDYYSMTSSSLPLDLYIIAKGTDGSKLDEFTNLIDRKLREAVENGIDKDLIDATLNSYEFNLKELGVHRGVILGITALRGWLYGNSPLDSLKFKETLERIKSKIDDGFIERYIEEKILNNPQKIHLVVNPKPGLFQEKDEKLEEELAKYKESLSKEEISNIVKDTQNLFQYQLQKDSKEDRDTIPKLQIEDISPGVRRLNVSEFEKDGIKSFFTDEFTNEIYYSALAFDLKKLTLEEIPYAGLVRDLLTSVDTKNYSFKDLNNQIDIHTGGINFATSTFEDKDSQEYSAVMGINGRANPEKIEKFLELLEEILLNSKFEDVNRIKDVLIMTKADLESNIEQSGHSLISSEVNSMMNDAIDLSNVMGGRKYLFFIRDIIERLDENPDEVLKTIQDVYKKIFNKKFLISVAGEKPWHKKTLDWALEFKENLESFENNLVFERKNISSIALTSSSNVVYVSDGFNYLDYGEKFSGKMRVLARVIDGDYLHTQIRAKGGAYGAGISINNKGNVVTYSYRDPNLDNTFKVYDEIYKYLEDLELTQEELTNYIISTMNQFDPPITPSQYASLAISRYLTDMGAKDLEKLKKEAIETTPEDIKNYAKLFKESLDNKFYGVLGSKDLIEKSNREYEEIVKIL